jgi:hypothetical protein
MMKLVTGLRIAAAMLLAVVESGRLRSWGCFLGLGIVLIVLGAEHEFSLAAELRPNLLGPGPTDRPVHQNSAR